MTTIFQFKITLMHTKPPIWRRIQIPAHLTFADLHSAVYRAMGWHGGHLHQFHYKHPVTKQTHYIGQQYSDDDDLPGTIPERKAKLAAFFKNVKDSVVYEYDFGDCWLHKIILEKVLTVEGNGLYPKCIGGRRACPPEDCGGVEGFYESLETCANPNHPEQEALTDWISNVQGYGEFKPEEFDPKDVVFGKVYPIGDGN